MSQYLHSPAALPPDSYRCQLDRNLCVSHNRSEHGGENIKSCPARKRSLILQLMVTAFYNAASVKLVMP
jgi:hypothetical protein